MPDPSREPAEPPARVVPDPFRQPADPPADQPPNERMNDLLRTAVRGSTHRTDIAARLWGVAAPNDNEAAVTPQKGDSDAAEPGQ